MLKHFCGVLFAVATLSCGSACPPPARAGLHLGPVPGPEDFEIQISGPAAPRLLVSSQKGRGFDSTQGQLYGISLVNGGGEAPPSTLKLTGRGKCSFHPHGISLVTPVSGPPLLYVINHHDAEDAERCLCDSDQAGRLDRRKGIHSIEVYEQRSEEAWHMTRRLLNTDFLTRPNDLAALPNGLIYVTNTPVSQAGLLWESLIGHSTSSVVMFDGLGWHRVAAKPRIANGIAVDWERSRLYVAEMAGRRITVFALDGPGGAKAPKRLGEIPVGSGVDNLSWGPEGPEGRTLWVASHRSLFAFAKLGRAWKRDHKHKPRSPSEVYRIRLSGDSGTPECVFCDDGQSISGASTAIQFGDSLLIGQVFDEFVLRYPYL